MRLRRLDLVRYGRFTGTTVDFGAREAGVPDLHVVYGANEAGKSTALNAWLDLLFGIEGQSSYAFLHPYGTMRIGAEVETGGRKLALSRIKGNKGTLLGEGGQPVPEAVVQGPLGGLDRRALSEMFSLDDATLEAGGNSILDSEGEVGQLLFASGAGLAGFAPALAALRKTPDPFFRAHSRSGVLAELKARLAEADAERAALDTDARGYRRLVEARDAAQAALDKVQAARDAPVMALRAVQRNLAALPGLRALEAAEARLAGLPDLPPPPEGWADGLAGLRRDAAAAEAGARVLAATQEELRRERGGLAADPAVLALRERIAAAGRLRSGHDEGVKDLPARRDEADRLARRTGDAMDRLGRAGQDPALALPGRAAMAEVRALIEERAGIAQALDLAVAELGRAEAEFAQAAGDLAGEAGSGGDVATLALLYRRLQDEAPAAALARATEALDAATAALDQRLRALLPWRGTGADLVTLVPSAPGVIADWKARAAEAVQVRATATGELRRLDAALAQPVVSEGDGGVTPDAAAQARSAREAAWAAHRASLDAATAEAFEAAMRRDDVMTAGLAETLARARRRAEGAVARAALVQERAQVLAGLEAVETADADLRAGIAVVLAEGGLPTMTPGALEAWLVLRGLAVEAHDKAVVAGQGAARAGAAVAEARGALLHALSLAGVEMPPDAGLPVLMARAGALCEAAAARAAKDEALRKAQAQVAARKEGVARAKGVFEDWQRRWSAALEAARLPPAQGVDAVREALDTLDALAAAHREHGDLVDRIAKMEANVAAYAGAVQALAADLGMEPDTPARLGEAILRRLQAADVTAERIEALERKLGRAAADAEAQRLALSGIEEQIAAMVTGFGATDADDLDHRLKQAAARVEALAQAARAGEALRETMDAATVDAARAALAGLDRDALTAEAERLNDEVTAQNAVTQERFAALAEAQRQLDAVGGDDAVLRLAEERETLLLQIAEGARDHLARKLGLIAVEHALRRYRDRHRSAMIEAASEAFRTMTRGAYTGLATQPEGAREVLVALAAGGGSKRAADLSKGTRFQLYLALRVAAYHERAAQGMVPPFVADDIMETFDDDRAAEAFEVMAGMAGKGQVIYLTHHRHLCDIARKVCPQVRLHHLGEGA
jgi:uncharacterized protein YhaN